jgi:hypothetical protein
MAREDQELGRYEREESGVAEVTTPSHFQRALEKEMDALAAEQAEAHGRKDPVRGRAIEVRTLVESIIPDEEIEAYKAQILAKPKAERQAFVMELRKQRPELVAAIQARMNQRSADIQQGLGVARQIGETGTKAQGAILRAQATAAQETVAELQKLQGLNRRTG